MKKTIRAFIGVGGNLGNRRAHLQEALARLGTHDGIRITRVSRWYETDPVGGPPQSAYLNGIAIVETELSPVELLAAMMAAERAAGRRRGDEGEVRWGPRTADLDLLLYGNEGERTSDDPEVTLPHPRMHERRFVLEPLCELAPDLLHPLLRRTIRSLLEDLEEGKC